MNIPLLERIALSGWGEAYKTQVRDSGYSFFASFPWAYLSLI
jgi:hypothetical protein